jgi:hypothetical protein
MRMRMRMRSTDRPDFKVNSPNRSTPFAKAASMNATFSASTPVVEDCTTLMVMYKIACRKEKEKKKRKEGGIKLIEALGRLGLDRYVPKATKTDYWIDKGYLSIDLECGEQRTSTRLRSGIEC